MSNRNRSKSPSRDFTSASQFRDAFKNGNKAKSTDFGSLRSTQNSSELLHSSGYEEVFQFYILFNSLDLKFFV